MSSLHFERLYSVYRRVVAQWRQHLQNLRTFTEIPIAFHHAVLVFQLLHCYYCPSPLWNHKPGSPTPHRKAPHHTEKPQLAVPDVSYPLPQNHSPRDGVRWKAQRAACHATVLNGRPTHFLLCEMSLPVPRLAGAVPFISSVPQQLVF